MEPRDSFLSFTMQPAQYCLHARWSKRESKSRQRCMAVKSLRQCILYANGGGAWPTLHPLNVAGWPVEWIVVSSISTPPRWMRHHQIASTAHVFLHGHYPLAIMPLLPLERLDHLLRTRFCLPCKYHPNKFDDLTSFFCLDCPRRSAQALCAWCLAKHAENTDHRILQARSPPSVSFHHQGTTPTKDTRE
jgi:hypothetical protein